MAAAAVGGFANLTGTRDKLEGSATFPSTSQTPQWTELDVSARLCIISRLWLVRRKHESNQVNQRYRAPVHGPLAVPNPQPKRSRPLSLPRNSELLTSDISNPGRADEPAQRRRPSLPHGERSPLPPPDVSRRRGRPEDVLFSSSIPEAYCDFSFEDGFIQHAGGKKKKNKGQSSNFNGPEKKEAGGAGDGGTGGGGNRNGDAGHNGGGSSGNGSGDDKKRGAGGPSPDDEARSETIAITGKKRSGINETRKVDDLLGAESKLEVFDDIKLDDTGPSLKLNIGSSTVATGTNPFSSWGSVWNTGLTTERPTAQAADETEDKKDESSSDAWGLDRPKQKKKNKISFGLGSFDEAEEGKAEAPSGEKNADEFDFGFASAGKTEKHKKKNNIWDAEPDQKRDPFSAPDAGSATGDDPWATPWTDTSKKSKRGVLDTTSDSYKPAPVAPTPDDDFWVFQNSKSSRKGKKEIIEKTAESLPLAPEPTPGTANKEDTQNNPWSITKKDKDKKRKKKDKAVDPEPEPTPEPAQPIKEPKLDTVPEPEPQRTSVSAPVSVPVAAPVATPVDAPAVAPVVAPVTAPAVKEATSAWNFWGATKKAIRATVEQLPSETAVVAQNNDDGWIGWGKKDNKKSSIEERKDESEHEGWWSFGRDKKKSPPPAPTPPPPDMDAAGPEMDPNIWNDPKIEHEQDSAAAALAAEIASEEQELADLEAKKLRKGFLSGKHQRRLDELIKNASQRAEQAAAKEAEDKARLEAEVNPAADALQAQESANAAAKALEAEIAAEEKELEKLKNRADRFLKRKKTLSTDDQERLDELTRRASARAHAVTEVDIAGNTEDVQAAVETEQRPILKADVPAIREVEEQAVEAKDQAALDADIAAEEEELEKLKAKMDRLSKKKRQLSAEQQLRFDELTERARARAAAVAKADSAADGKDPQTVREVDRLTTYEEEGRASDGIEDQVTREAAEEAAREAREAAADEAELAALQNKKKLLKSDKKRIEELTERINSRVAPIATGGEIAQVAIGEPAAREREEQVVLEAGKHYISEAEEQAQAEAQAARKADEAKEDAEFETLRVKLKKKRLNTKDQARFDMLQERINARVAPTDHGENAPAAIEDPTADDYEEQAIFEAWEQGTPDVVDEVQAEVEAARKAEEAAEDAEFEDLRARLEKRKRLSPKDKARFVTLEERINARVTTTDHGENAPDAIVEPGTGSTEEHSTPEMEQQAALEAAAQAKREAKEMEAARKAEEDADDAELETLTVRRNKKKKLPMKDQERFDMLTRKVNARISPMDPDGENADAAVGHQVASKTTNQTASKTLGQAPLTTAEPADRDAEAMEAARKAEEDADNAELEALTVKQRSKWKNLSRKDQERFDMLTAKINARVPNLHTDNGNAQTVHELEELVIHEAGELSVRNVKQTTLEADEQAAREAEQARAEAEAARKAAEAEEDAEFEALRARLEKRRRPSPKDQARFDILKEKIRARKAAIDPDGKDPPVATEEQIADEEEEQTAPDVEEQAEHEAEAIARKAQEDEEDAEFESLRTKSSKKKKLSMKDQERLNELTERINARVAIPHTKGRDAQTTQETEDPVALEAEDLAALEAESLATREVEQRAREAEEQAARQAEEQAKVKAEEEARKAAEDKEDSELETLKAKLKKKKKLSTKDQERFYKLNQKINSRTAAIETRNDIEELAARESEAQAARKAEQAAQAAREAEEQAERERKEVEDVKAAVDKPSMSGSEDQKDYDDDFDLDDVDLTAEQADEILSSLPPPTKPKSSNPFTFWGVKNILKSPPPEVICTSQPRHPVAAKFGLVESPKLVESPRLVEDVTIATTKAANPGALDDDRVPKKSKDSKLVEKLKKFEPETESFHRDLIDVLPEAPSPPLPPSLLQPQGDMEIMSTQTSKDIVPGGFPGGFPMTDEDRDDESLDGNDEDEILETVNMALEERRSEKSILKSDADLGYRDEDEISEIIESSPPVERNPKKSKRNKFREDLLSPVPPAVPPPPPAAPDSPDAPATPSPELKPSRKERVKNNRDGSAPRGMWSASAASHMEEKLSSRSWSNAKKTTKEREEKVSTNGSGSDKAEQQQDTTPMLTSRPRMSSVFQSTPPISRSMSTRNKFAENPNSRRYSAEMSGGLVSPPSEEIYDVAPKAARFLGVDKGRSQRTPRTHAAATLDDEIAMGRAHDLTSSPDKSARKRSKVKSQDSLGLIYADGEQAKPDGNIAMAEAKGPVNVTPLKRSSSSAKKGISGLFGGLMHSNPRPEPRPEPRRRSTYHATEDEGRPDKRARPMRRMSSFEPDIDPDREARRAARKARREQEKIEEAQRAEEALRAKEARRERRRRQEEELEDLRRQEEREARRAERRAAREREAQRLAYAEAEAKEAERAERRRRRRLEKEAAAELEAEAEAEARRAARAARRRSQYMEGSENEEERRRRREARRAERTSQHRSVPVDDFAYARERSSRYTDDERRKKTPAWPHSGTSSWVKDHSESGPPPEDGLMPDAPRAMDDEEARRAARRAARRREKYDDMNMNKEYDDEQRRRRVRREERERRDDRERRDERERRERRIGRSDSSGEKGPRDSFFTDTPRSSWWRKLTGS